MCIRDSYYLDQAHFVPEKVTEDLLDSTVRRVAQGVERIVEIAYMGKTPELKPGLPCRWCPALDNCDTGKRHLFVVDVND